MSSVSTTSLSCPGGPPGPADVVLLLNQTRRRISVVLTVRTALAFFAVGCVQALVLIGLACFLHGAVLLAGLLVAGGWPFAVRPVMHSRLFAGLMHDSGLTGPPDLLRLLRAARWGILLSVLPAAAMALFANMPPLGLMAFDAAAACVAAGIWSVKLPTQKRIAWLVDQQAGLDGSLSLWLEKAPDSGATAGNPFYVLTWQRVQGRWEQICRAAAGLKADTGVPPRSMSVLIAIGGFSVLAVGAGLLLAGSLQSRRESAVASAGRVAPVGAKGQTTSSVGLHANSPLIHALPPSLAKQLLQGKPATGSGPPAIRQLAESIADIRQDIHRRQSWKKTLNTLEKAIHQKLVAEVGQKAGGPAAMANSGAAHAGNADGNSRLSPNWHQNGSSQLTANLVQALHHAGLSAVDRNRILAAARGFSGRAGASGLHDLQSAVADAHAAQVLLGRELSAERKLLAEISHRMAVSAPLSHTTAGNFGGNSATAATGAPGNSGISAMPISSAGGSAESNPGGSKQKTAFRNDNSATLVDSKSMVILDKPLMDATHHSIDLPPHGGRKADYGAPALRRSVIQNRTEMALPAGYRRLIRSYFEQ